MSVLQMTIKCIVDIKWNKITSQISPKAPILSLRHAMMPLKLGRLKFGIDIDGLHVTA